MNIKVDSITGVAPLEKAGKARLSETPPAEAKPPINDVDISRKAVDRADFLRALDIVKAAESPELRADRVAELKAKINDPAYINESIIKLTADRVADLLLS